jgi:hypothetical protein
VTIPQKIQAPRTKSIYKLGVEELFRIKEPE